MATKIIFDNYDVFETIFAFTHVKVIEMHDFVWFRGVQGGDIGSRDS